MTMRQVRLGIDLFTVIMVASVGVALAGLTWRLTGTSGALPVAAAVAGSTGEPVDIGGLLALAPFGTVEAASDAASDGSLHLQGILLAVPASGSTALVAGADNKVASYGIGAALGGGVVEAIAADHLVLRTPHGLQSVGFAAAAGAPAAATPGAIGKAAGFVPVAVAGPQPGAAGTAGIIAQGGIRITTAAPAALFAAGLQPGDVVEQVNGTMVSPGIGADQVGHDLANAALRGGGVPVVILRDGSRISLRLAIH